MINFMSVAKSLLSKVNFFFTSIFLFLVFSVSVSLYIAQKNSAIEKLNVKLHSQQVENGALSDRISILVNALDDAENEKLELVKTLENERGLAADRAAAFERINAELSDKISMLQDAENAKVTQDTTFEKCVGVVVPDDFIKLFQQ